MKVKELIAELQKHDPEKEVIARHYDRGSFAHGPVEVREGKHKTNRDKICVEGTFR